MLKRLLSAAEFGNCRVYASSTAKAGGGRKGIAEVKLPNGTLRKVELHWYEASGIGKMEFKIKRFVD